jgi:hypothetical protein
VHYRMQLSVHLILICIPMYYMEVKLKYTMLSLSHKFFFFLSRFHLTEEIVLLVYLFNNITFLKKLFKPKYLNVLVLSSNESSSCELESHVCVCVLFICDAFNDSDRILDYIMLNGRMISE